MNLWSHHFSQNGTIRAEILTIFGSYFGRNHDFINSFWNLLTFSSMTLISMWCILFIRLNTQTWIYAILIGHSHSLLFLITVLWVFWSIGILKRKSILRRSNRTANFVKKYSGFVETCSCPLVMVFWDIILMLYYDILWWKFIMIFNWEK